MRFKDFARWTLERGGFCTNDRLGAFLTRICPVQGLFRVAHSAGGGRHRTAQRPARDLPQRPISDAVRASCAYPGMFTPVEINGVLHVDGMLSYEVPTTPLKQMGIDCVHGSSSALALDPDPQRPGISSRSSANASPSRRHA